MTFILLGLLVASALGTAGLLGRKTKFHEKTVIKEIEVVKKAVCECGHVSSVHNHKGCQEMMIKLSDGTVMTNWFKCACSKYTGPQPMSEYFDDYITRELESHRT